MDGLRRDRLIRRIGIEAVRAQEKAALAARRQRKCRPIPVPPDAGKQRADRNAASALKRRERQLTDLTPFVGVDGEAITTPEGEHRLVLLADSTGRRLEDLAGIGWREALDWLLGVPGIPVGFSFGYDTTMILRSAPAKVLTHLAKEGWATLKGIGDTSYRVSIVPRHVLHISRYAGEKKQAKVTIWDTFGFFQSSFLKALLKWNVGTPEEQAFIQVMKERRAGFAVLDASLIAYNDLECRLLAAMMSLVRDACQQAGIAMNRWDGAGAVAGALLRQRRIPEVLPLPCPVALHAYYGGRMQALRSGRVPGPIYTYDINSAYPAAAVELPRLTGEWEEVTGYQPGRVACHYVTWDIPPGHKKDPLTPFPVRTRCGSILYPGRGAGWYWHPEVEAALSLWPGHVQVTRGYTIRELEEWPFDWIQELYQRRKVAEAGEGMMLKLGINSCYGKLAQGTNARGIPPKTQCYAYAGIITSVTRARLLLASAEAPGSIVSLATDGIKSTAPLSVPVSDNLGEWSGTREVEGGALYVFAPGRYAYVDGDGHVLRSWSSGYSSTELSFPDLIRVWHREGNAGALPLTVTRFVSYRQALSWGRPESAGTWEAHNVRLACYTGQGELKKRKGVWWVLPPAESPDGQSVAYKPKLWHPDGGEGDDVYDLAEYL